VAAVKAVAAAARVDCNISQFSQMIPDWSRTASPSCYYLCFFYPLTGPKVIGLLILQEKCPFLNPLSLYSPKTTKNSFVKGGQLWCSLQFVKVSNFSGIAHLSKFPDCTRDDTKFRITKLCIHLTNLSVPCAKILKHKKDHQ
jgi:hypothetical protein